MKRRSLFRFIPARLALLVAPLIAAWPQASRAATVYWDGSGTLWSALGSWSTAAGATTPDPTAVPVAADLASFNISTVNTTQTVSLNANQAALGLVFTSTGATTLQGGGTNRALTLGASGISKTGTGAATVGSGTANQNVTTALSADQTWSNTNATGALTVANSTAPSTAVARTLTLTGAGAASAMNGGINNNGAGVMTVAKTGTIQWTLGAAGTFSGGLTIGDGAVVLGNATAAGTAAINLNAGGTTGTATRLLVSGGVTIANAVNINGAITGAAGLGTITQTGTGQGRINGAISITGSPTGGGHLIGGAAAGNELFLGGVVTSTVPLTQRDGRVIYGGGGTGYNSLSVTGTALLGANNGIATTAAVGVGVSNNGTLDLNGFDQSLPSLTLGNATVNNAQSGTVNIGAKTLTVTGDISTLNTGTGNVTHSINSTTGILNLGAGSPSITVADTVAIEDLAISAAMPGTGGFKKMGTGTLSLNGAIAGPVNVNAGGIAAGRNAVYGSFSTPTLAFAGGTALRAKISTTGSDVINAGTLTTVGVTTVSVVQPGGALPVGVYPIINYTGTSPGIAGFTLAATGRLVGNIKDTGSAIAVEVTGNDSVIWDGTTSTAWNTATTNWKLVSNSTPANFIPSDAVIFPDAPTNSTVDIATTVAASNVQFVNTAATTYTVTGANGMSGPMNLVVSGGGQTILRNSSSFTGSVTISNGTLELDHDAPSNVVLSGSSGVSVAAGSTLKLTRDDADFTYSRSTSGAGKVIVDAHSAAAAGSRSVTISGNNTDFTGDWELTPTVAGALGTFRWSTATPAQVGAGRVKVNEYAQFWTGGATFNNSITLTGTGYSEGAGGTPIGLGALADGVYVGTDTPIFAYAGIGAIRMNANDVLSGNILTVGNTKITPFNVTGTISGTLTSTNPSDILVAGGGTSNSTLVVTGNLNPGRLLINGGSAATNTQHAVQIGNNNALGGISTPEIILYGSPRADFGSSALLHIARSDGYTIPESQSIIGAAAASADLQRIRIVSNTPGTGVLVNGKIDLADTITGGLISVGTAVNNASMTFGPTAQVDVNYISLGDAANISTSVTQVAGSTVNAVGQLRVGHFGTETSVYNMNGGTLTLSGPSPVNTPSTGTGGSTTVSGDNNIVISNPTSIVGGGIYVGIDGQGVMNHNGGDVTTNWIVLDNRGDSPLAANMSDGIDRYNLSGGTLNLRSNYGIIGRNVSHAVSFAGGTVKADNSGTGTGAGLNLNIPLDANITVSAATSLDTNGATNAFTLTRSVQGSGALTLKGGGTLNLNTAGTQTISSPLVSSGAGMSLVKQGTGTSSLTASGAGFTGAVTVSAGRLDLPNDTALTDLTLNTGATVSGEPLVNGPINLTGGTIFMDPNTPGALRTAGNLDVTGAIIVDMTAAPAGSGPWTVVNYGTKSGAGTFSVANPTSFRTTPSVVDTGTSITLDILAGKGLVWSGATNGLWDINSTTNWVDLVPAPEKFFNADVAVFPEAALNPSVALTGNLSPLSVAVTSDTTAYTFTSTAGNQLIGPTGISKSGASMLTLVGPNLHTGATAISGGAVSIASSASLGNGSSTNGVNLSNGGRLIFTAAQDLGTPRNVTVGTGGGGFTMSNAAAQTVTIPGNIVGTAPLAFSSTLAGGGTFSLSGDNSGYTGAISIGSTSTGLSAVALASQSAVPGGGSITLNYPAAGVNGNASSLNLTNNTLPTGLTLNMTSFLNGAISLRSQVSSAGSSVINSPITVSGNSIVQFTTTGTITYNGNITEAAPGGFAGVVFPRGTGTHIINGTWNLPTAGSSVSVTDGALCIVNSTGNIAPGSAVLFGTFRLGISNALPTAGTLIVGQTADQVCAVDLNGFDQTVATMTFAPPTGNLLTKGITNSNAAATSTFTVNQNADATFNGTFSGKINLVKAGPNMLTLPASNSNTPGNITVNAGTLVASAGGAAAGANSTLGAVNVVGKQITVNTPGLLNFTSNNVLGNGVANANLPALNINGTTVNSTRYNVLGPVNLSGGTLAQASTDSGNYEGYQFKGTVTVAGTGAAIISTSAGKANHLDTNTTFNVGEVATGTDLLVSAPLRNQSADFAGAAGGLTKTGAGTMQLAATTTSSYTGPTAVNGGVLRVEGTISASAVSVNTTGTLGGSGTLGGAVSVNSGGTVAPGASVGTLNFGSTLTLAAGSNYAVEITGAATNDKVIVTGALSAGGTIVVSLVGYTPVLGDTFDIANAASTTGTPTFNFASAVLGAGLAWDTSTFATDGIIKVIAGATDPFDAWATSYGLTGGKAGDDDHDGFNNLLEFATNANPKNGTDGPRAFGKVHTIGGVPVLTLTVAVRKSAVFAAAGADQTATKDKIIYTVEGSDDLGIWNNVVISKLNPADSASVQASLVLPTLDADWEWQTFRTDDNVIIDPRDFIRLHVVAE